MKKSEAQGFFSTLDPNSCYLRGINESGKPCELNFYSMGWNIWEKQTTQSRFSAALARGAGLHRPCAGSAQLARAW